MQMNTLFLFRCFLCFEQVNYSADEYFENTLRTTEVTQKKRLKKLRIKVNKDE